MSYHGVGATFDWDSMDVKGTLTSANAQAADAALSKMNVSAAYAGPLSQAEQSAFLTVLESGASGRIPTPDQFASSIKGAAVGVATVAAAGACGPAAPLCGAAANYVASKMAEGIFGSGSNCGVTINGLCAGEYYALLKAKVQKLCPQGDDDCRKKVGAIVDSQLVLVNANYENYTKWSQRCGKPTSPWGTPSYPADCYSDCAEKNIFQQPICVSEKLSKGISPSPPKNLPVMTEKQITDAVFQVVMPSRYRAEYNYLKAVDAQTEALKSKIVPLCNTAGCKTQVGGILGEGAYEAAQALRSPTGGPSTAKRVIDQAMLQAQGVVEQSRQISALQLEADQQAEDQKDLFRKLALGGLLVAAVAVGAYAWRKHR